MGPCVSHGRIRLTLIDGVVRFGSLYEYVASFPESLFGADVGETIDNGLSTDLFYFFWFAVL